MATPLPWLTEIAVAELSQVAEPNVPGAPPDLPQQFVHAIDDGISATICQGGVSVGTTLTTRRLLWETNGSSIGSGRTE